MIPSVQLLTNNGVPSAIHKDVLEKFVFPITPNSSPIGPDQLQQQQQQQQIHHHYEQEHQHHHEHKDELMTEHELIEQEEIFCTYLNEEDTTATNKYTQLSGISDMNDINMCSSDTEINYTIINDRVVVNTFKCVNNRLTDINENSDDVLMQIVDIPMVFCSSMTPTTVSNTTTTTTVDLCDLTPPHESLVKLKSDENDLNKNNNENNENNNNNNNSTDDVVTSEADTEKDSEEKVDTKIDNDDFDEDDDDGSSSEQELTNLGWLIDLKNLTNWSADAATSTKRNAIGPSNLNANGLSNCIIDDIDDDDGCIEPIISDRDLSEERFKKFTIQVKQSQINYAERENVYKMDPLEKPPFNYAQIIAMAMMDQGRMTLKEICKWIQEHFAYFRYNKNWNNSIRHNLSLHFCFTKIARDKTEKGKGGYWELSMNTAKSEKKRIRNRRKQRDECGRFSNHHRHHPMRKSSQKLQWKSNSKSIINKTKVLSNHCLVANDSCNVSNASEGSSSISSTIGHTEDVFNHSYEIMNDDQPIHILQHQTIQTEHIQQELLNNIIVNDLVIINENGLHQTANGIIDCHFDKNSQINDNYFLEQAPNSDTAAAQSNEIYIKSDLPLCGASDIITNPYTKTHYQSKLAMQAQRTLDLFQSDHIGSDSSGRCINRSVDFTTSIGNTQPHFGNTMSSNVIVEPLPYTLSHMDTVIDIEHEFSSLVNMPDPELTEEGFFDYANW